MKTYTFDDFKPIPVFLCGAETYVTGQRYENLMVTRAMLISELDLNYYAVSAGLAKAAECLTFVQPPGMHLMLWVLELGPVPPQPRRTVPNILAHNPEFNAATEQVADSLAAHKLGCVVPSKLHGAVRQGLVILGVRFRVGWHQEPSKDWFATFYPVPDNQRTTALYKIPCPKN